MLVAIELGPGVNKEYVSISLGLTLFYWNMYFEYAYYWKPRNLAELVYSDNT